MKFVKAFDEFEIDPTPSALIAPESKRTLLASPRESISEGG